MAIYTFASGGVTASFTPIGAERERPIPQQPPVLSIQMALGTKQAYVSRIKYEPKRITYEVHCDATNAARLLDDLNGVQGVLNDTVSSNTYVLSRVVLGELFGSSGVYQGSLEFIWIQDGTGS